MQPQDVVLFLKRRNIQTGVICNYSNVVASKLHIVSDLKEGIVKMSKNPYLFLALINWDITSCLPRDQRVMWL